MLSAPLPSARREAFVTSPPTPGSMRKSGERAAPIAATTLAVEAAGAAQLGIKGVNSKPVELLQFDRAKVWDNVLLGKFAISFARFARSVCWRNCDKPMSGTVSEGEGATLYKGCLFSRSARRLASRVTASAFVPRTVWGAGAHWGLPQATSGGRWRCEGSARGLRRRSAG